MVGMPECVHLDCLELTWIWSSLGSLWPVLAIPHKLPGRNFGTIPKTEGKHPEFSPPWAPNLWKDVPDAARHR